jgi:uncharacterized protein (TIGR00251 family)
VLLAVHVQPGARHEGAAGLHGQRLRLRVADVPERGRANERAIELVAGMFGLRRADVTLVAGQSSRRKEMELAGLSLEAATEKLEALLAALQDARA